MVVPPYVPRVFLFYHFFIFSSFPFWFLIFFFLFLCSSRDVPQNKLRYIAIAWVGGPNDKLTDTPWGSAACKLMRS